MSLFSQALEAEAPLAHRMRPRDLSEIVGHELLVGPAGSLTRILGSGRLPSCILWGPPGCGKTTLARLLARRVDARFEVLSAVGSGVAELRRVLDEAARARQLGTRTVLFIDEIHRFNKAQQDVLLPHVEQGAITLIGATTEHPGLEVNPALRSRTAIHRLEPLGTEALVALFTRALVDPDRGLGKAEGDMPREVLEALATWSGGDARAGLGALEALVMAGVSDPASLDTFLGQARLAQDKDGSGHYDVISVLIKAMRGSDPDAALHWLARLLEGGEDPLFVARRLVIFASEDIGNAEPLALLLATAAVSAVQQVGMPEARIALGQAVTFLATAPRSNAAYVAINEALEDVRKDATGEVPPVLRGLAARDGARYRYPHDMPGAFDPEQDFWPRGRAVRRYYRPEGRGHERRILQRLHHWQARRREVGNRLPSEDSAPLPPLPAMPDQAAEPRS